MYASSTIIHEPPPAANVAQQCIRGVGDASRTDIDWEQLVPSLSQAVSATGLPSSMLEALGIPAVHPMPFGDANLQPFASTSPLLVEKTAKGSGNVDWAVHTTTAPVSRPPPAARTPPVQPPAEAPMYSPPADRSDSPQGLEDSFTMLEAEEMQAVFAASPPAVTLEEFFGLAPEFAEPVLSNSIAQRTNALTTNCAANGQSSSSTPSLLIDTGASSRDSPPLPTPSPPKVHGQHVMPGVNVLAQASYYSPLFGMNDGYPAATHQHGWPQSADMPPLPGPSGVFPYPGMLSLYDNSQQWHASQYPVPFDANRLSPAETPDPPRNPMTRRSASWIPSARPRSIVLPSVPPVPSTSRQQPRANHRFQPYARAQNDRRAVAWELSAPKGTMQPSSWRTGHDASIISEHSGVDGVNVATPQGGGVQFHNIYAATYLQGANGSTTTPAVSQLGSHAQASNNTLITRDQSQPASGAGNAPPAASSNGVPLTLPAFDYSNGQKYCCPACAQNPSAPEDRKRKEHNKAEMRRHYQRHHSGIQERHGTHDLCIFCNTELKVVRPRYFKDHRQPKKPGKGQKQCSTIAELGGPTAYKNIYAYIVLHGLDIHHWQIEEEDPDMFDALMAIDARTRSAGPSTSTQVQAAETEQNREPDIDDVGPPYVNEPVAGSSKQVEALGTEAAVVEKTRDDDEEDLYVD